MSRCFSPDHQELVGIFTHAETGKEFEYRKNKNECQWEPANAYEFEVFVGPDGESLRFARILKTVAYVVVDQDDGGNPIEERWPIKQHRSYTV